MSLSTPFIERPVATTLLTIGLALAGLFAFFKLPVAPLPQIDFPTISVFAQMPGASPETMATTVATPLERHLGVIADVTEMTSQSTVGSSRITLQFALGRNIDGAARDVQAAIVAARVDLPTSLRTNPTYRKVNPADAPILILSLTSDTRTRGQVYDAASTILQPALSQIEGVGQVTIGGAAAPAVRVELNPLALFKYGIGLEDVRAALASANAHSPKGAVDQGDDGGRAAVRDADGAGECDVKSMLALARTIADQRRRRPQANQIGANQIGAPLGFWRHQPGCACPRALCHRDCGVRAARLCRRKAEKALKRQRVVGNLRLDQQPRAAGNTKQLADRPTAAPGDRERSLAAGPVQCGDQLLPRNVRRAHGACVSEAEKNTS